ncbi:MAG: hypothetical protein CMJ64_04630 [Planctomycetaceae bacterium]|nr:hypothetical protein [Planctomycetaceae bacterium]
MTQITVDAELAAKLLSAGAHVEIVDEAGNRLGDFQRQLTWDELMATCPYTQEELEEFRQQAGTGRPLADIVRDLEKLP